MGRGFSLRKPTFSPLGGQAGVKGKSKGERATDRAAAAFPHTPAAHRRPAVLVALLASFHLWFTLRIFGSFRHPPPAFSPPRRLPSLQRGRFYEFHVERIISRPGAANCGHSWRRDWAQNSAGSCAQAGSGRFRHKYVEQGRRVQAGGERPRCETSGTQSARPSVLSLPPSRRHSTSV